MRSVCVDDASRTTVGVVATATAASARPRAGRPTSRAISTAATTAPAPASHDGRFARRSLPPSTTHGSRTRYSANGGCQSWRSIAVG
jgi:hypothetical protein